MPVKVNWIKDNSVTIEHFKNQRSARKAIKRSNPTEVRRVHLRHFRGRQKVYFVFL